MSPAGERTIAILELNRTDLVEQRRKKLMRARRLYSIWEMHLEPLEDPEADRKRAAVLREVTDLLVDMCVGINAEYLAMMEDGVARDFNPPAT